MGFLQTTRVGHTNCIVWTSEIGVVCVGDKECTCSFFVAYIQHIRRVHRVHLHIQPTMQLVQSTKIPQCEHTQCAICNLRILQKSHSENGVLYTNAHANMYIMLSNACVLFDVSKVCWSRSAAACIKIGTNHIARKIIYGTAIYKWSHWRPVSSSAVVI